MALRLLSRRLPAHGQRTLAIGAGKLAQQLLDEAPQTDITRIGNDMSVASENTGAGTATVGVWVKGGSRYDDKFGTANMHEQLLYRGTNKRTQTQLETELASIGAEMRSFTTRDNAAVYVQCLASQVDKAVDILADVVNNPKLDSSTVDGEKERVLRRMDELDDDNHAVVMNNLHTAAFQGTPMAHGVLGTAEHVQSLTADDLAVFHRSNYQGHRMALVGAGGISHDQLVSLADKHFGQVGNGDSAKSATGVRFTGSEFLYRDDSMPFCYSAFAVETVGSSHQDSLALAMGALLLGSWDPTYGCNLLSPNSLARKISEDLPNVKSFSSFYLPYEDTGLLGTYGVLKDVDHNEYTIIVTDALKTLCQSTSDSDVLRGRNMMKTHLMQRLDGSTNIARDIGRQVLSTGGRLPLKHLIDRIDSISAADVNDVFMRHVYDRDIAVAAVGEIEAHTQYGVLRPRMCFWRL